MLDLSNLCHMLESSSVDLSSAAHDLHSHLKRDGYVHLRTAAHAPVAGTSLNVALVKPFAMQIKIFDKVPLRREVSVRLDRPVNRSEGIGASPLHIDFVNAAFPPEFVCLYCIRPDPLDGGTSVIAPLRESLDSIDARHLQPLSDAVFRDGTVVDLSNVGRDSNPFAVFSPHGRWVYRFTSNLLLDPVSPEHNDALMNLREALVAHQQTIQLHEGDALLMDQRRVVHGKNELGIGQDTLPGIKRRLLRQGFFREISSFTNS